MSHADRIPKPVATGRPLRLAEVGVELSEEVKSCRSKGRSKGTSIVNSLAKVQQRFRLANAPALASVLQQQATQNETVGLAAGDISVDQW
jgi:hypothetical protein